MRIMLERHYAVEAEKTTLNLSSVLAHVPAENYNHMASFVDSIGSAYERRIGTVKDETQYYTFSGSNTLFEHGVVQVGKAVTGDNQEGFRMTRLFANSAEDMSALEAECILFRKEV